MIARSSASYTAAFRSNCLLASSSCDLNTEMILGAHYGCFEYMRMGAKNMRLCEINNSLINICFAVMLSSESLWVIFEIWNVCWRSYFNRYTCYAMAMMEAFYCVFFHDRCYMLAMFVIWASNDIKKQRKRSWRKSAERNRIKGIWSGFSLSYFFSIKFKLRCFQSSHHFQLSFSYFQNREAQDISRGMNFLRHAFITLPLIFT